MNALKQQWYEEIQERAFRAARDLFGPVSASESVLPLKLRPKRDTAVLSWGMNLSDGNTVEIVAKRSSLKKARREHLLYTKLLPDMGLDTLHCYGLISEPDGLSAWIFIELAHGEDYCPENHDHVDLAMEWLSILHSCPLSPEEQALFPERGPEHYNSCLHIALAGIEEGRKNKTLSARDFNQLSGWTQVLGCLESRWDVVCSCLLYTSDAADDPTLV